jgi:uncharacterized membrane protein
MRQSWLTVVIKGGYGRQIWLWAAILLHCALFSIIGISRHWGYMSNVYDLGVFDQVVWNTLHGNFLRTTINPFAAPINWLGFHFQPILLLFVPLYALCPGVGWFIAAQAAALALTAWPLFLLAKDIFQSEKVAVIWALVYLANPFLLSAGAWDFHPISLAVPFIALGFLAVVKKNLKMLVLACLLLLTCKEHLGLAVAGFGALWWFRHRSWQPAAVITALGLGHLILVLCLIMPLLSPIGKPVMLGAQLGQLSRYGWLGNSLPEIFQTMTTQPLFVWENLVAMGGLAYLFLLVMPFAFVMPFLGLAFLLPGVADLAANCLSENPMPRGIWAYHSVGLIPVLTATAISGVERLSHWQKKFSTLELTGLTLATSLVTGYFFLPLPLLGAFNIWAPRNFLNWPDQAGEVVRAVVAGPGGLSVQANVGAHFSQRANIHVYPDKGADGDNIILRLASPTTNINGFPKQLAENSVKQRPNWLDGHLQMDRTEYLASIDCLMAKQAYGVLLWHDPWLVLSRQSKERPLGVAQKIRKLRSDWQIDPDEYHDALQNCLANS